jgi:hypothetical protein
MKSDDFKSDEDTSAVPLHCKPPNTGYYLLRLGVPQMNIPTNGDDFKLPTIFTPSCQSIPVPDSDGHQWEHSSLSI